MSSESSSNGTLPPSANSTWDYARAACMVLVVSLPPPAASSDLVVRPAHQPSVATTPDPAELAESPAAELAVATERAAGTELVEAPMTGSSALATALVAATELVVVPVTSVPSAPTVQEQEAACSQRYDALLDFLASAPPTCLEVAADAAVLVEQIRSLFPRGLTPVATFEEDETVSLQWNQTNIYCRIDIVAPQKYAWVGVDLARDLSVGTEEDIVVASLPAQCWEFVAAFDEVA